MRLLPSACLAALLALNVAPAHATQEYILPTLFDVARVASDDVLNIRQRPDARSPVIGTLAPDATGIEVVEQIGNWGRVNAGEISGWVSMRYLDYRTDVWEWGQLPQGFSCYGTEPFWSLHAEGGDLVHATPEGETRHRIGAILDSGVFRDPARAIVAGPITLTATPQVCSDGMSDRVMGLRAMAVMNGTELLTGCCRIAR
ncbi:SH3 domain-containing protein [Paracoccus bogoriensis]|uniref:COG3650 family protein n=1 Tax=Paracoccus bogoriensis TaxID=242065 RepID=UPI001CA51376|nr:SH3 domain-containing protein [Paracoccus bogoriensis]MBW7056215.1 SH3 domain-containing protein [Paracoccus bogoriensis]